MRRNQYRGGDHLLWCDRCGTTYYNSQTRREWTGLRVCYGPGTRDCWEPRHPVDFLRVIRDDFSVENARPRNTACVEDVFPNGVSGDDL